MNVTTEIPTFSSPLAEKLLQFLQFKRAVGYRYIDEQRLLTDLDVFFARHIPANDPIITLDLIRAYVARRGTESDSTQQHRLSLIREVCRFLAVDQPQTAIPGFRFLGIHRRPFTARVLTVDEAQRFLQACKQLNSTPCSPLRQIVLGTALPLLLLTGLRAGEVVRLTDDDVDLTHRLLRIRNTKFGKSRFVPIADDICKRLATCRAEVSVRFGVRTSESLFFPTPNDHRYSLTTLRAAFQQVLTIAGIPRKSAGRSLRMHDLRHSFAVLRLLIWYRQEADLGAKLPLLATYMGHVALTSSQRYLQLTEDMAGEVTRRFEARFGHLIRETQS